jgi:hypothetical protein
MGGPCQRSEVGGQKAEGSRGVRSGARRRLGRGLGARARETVRERLTPVPDLDLNLPPPLLPDLHLAPDLTP